MRVQRGRGSVLPAACLLLALPANGAEPGDPGQLRQQVEAAWSAGQWPVAEQRLTRLHQQDPGDAEILRRWGLAAAYQGDYEPALRRLRRARALSPDNTDILLALARVHAWRGAREEAEAQVAAILARFPDLAEAHVLRGRLAYYRGDLAAAEDHYRTALERDPESSGARTGLEQAQTARAGHTPWRLDASHTRSRVHIGDVSLGWRATDLAMARTFGGPAAERPWILTTRVHRAERAGDTGRQIALGGAWPVTADGTLRAEVGGAAGADFLPRRHWRLGGNWRLREGGTTVGATALDAAVDQRRYADGDTWILAPALEQAFWNSSAGPRLQTTWQLLAVRGSQETWETGYAVRLDARVHRHWRIHGGYSVAYETDETYDADGTVTGLQTAQVRTASMGLAWRFSGRRELGCGVTRQERDHAASWRREAWRCNLTWRH